MGKYVQKGLIDPDQSVGDKPDAGSKSLAPLKELNTGKGYDIYEQDLEKPEVAKVLARMFMSEVRRLKSDIENLSVFQEKYHISNEKCLVLEEKVRALSDAVNSRVLLFTLGGTLIGFIWSPYGLQYWYIFLTLSVVCFALGLWKSSIFKSNKPV